MKLFDGASTLRQIQVGCIWISIAVLQTGFAAGTVLAAPARPPRAHTEAAPQPEAQGPVIPPRFDDQGNFLGSYRATEPRTLIFPGTKSYGGLAVTIQNKASGRSTSRTYKAQGRVVVPRDGIVTFYPEFAYFEKPHDLDGMAPNSFDNVVVRFVSMEDKDEGKLDNAIGALNHFTGINFIDVSRTEASDKGLSQLKSLTNLEYLDCFLCEINGSFLEHLVNCKKLKWLALSQNKLTPHCLSYLPQYTGLKFLELTRTNLSGTAAYPLGHCNSLQILDIRYNNQLGADTDKLLMKLPNLKVLKVSPGQLSRERLAQFKSGGRPDLVCVVDLSIAKKAQLKQNRNNQDETTTDGFANSVFKPLSKGRGF